MLATSRLWKSVTVFAFAICFSFGPGCAVSGEEPNDPAAGEGEGAEDEDLDMREGESVATCNTICGVGGGSRVCLKTGTWATAAVCGLATTALCGQVCQNSRYGIPKRICREPGAGRTCVLWDNLPWRTPRKCVGWTC